jgi:hypothetical protein
MTEPLSLKAWLAAKLGTTAIRTPDFVADGWCLEDGEEYHRKAPATFQIPDLDTRKILQPGDFAKLIFRIAVDDGSESFERMWVIVREQTVTGYMGMLDNEPDTIGKNNAFWVGAELPFEYRHIIDVARGNADSKATAIAPPDIPWRRS